MPRRVAFGHAESSGVALSQQEADAFMAADKVVPGHEKRIVWKQPNLGGVGIWRGPVEIDAARVGELFMHVNPAQERSWLFKLSFRAEEVYRLDVKPPPYGHNNWTGCPAGFPRKVKCPVHEHVYVEGFGCHCAWPVDDLVTSDHAAIFQWFCDRTHVRFEPTYDPPQFFPQMPML